MSGNGKCYEKNIKAGDAVLGSGQGMVLRGGDIWVEICMGVHTWRKNILGTEDRKPKSPELEKHV